MSTTNAREAYAAGTDYQFDQQEIPLGPWTSYSLVHDPKHMSFVLARYKFCAKMLEGRNTAVEIGSGAGFGLPDMAQAVQRVCCVDCVQRLLDGNKRRLPHLQNVYFILADLNEAPVRLQADACY